MPAGQQVEVGKFFEKGHLIVIELISGRFVIPRNGGIAPAEMAGFVDWRDAWLDGLGKIGH